MAAEYLKLDFQVRGIASSPRTESAGDPDEVSAGMIQVDTERGLVKSPMDPNTVWEGTQASKF
jgi:hypothetical protein